MRFIGFCQSTILAVYVIWPTNPVLVSLKAWALYAQGWQLPDSDQTYDIGDLFGKENEGEYSELDALSDQIFYKERWLNDEGLDQRLIVTFLIEWIPQALTDTLQSAS